MVWKLCFLDRSRHGSQVVLPGKCDLTMEYNINKGIGKPAEFRGLKAQYLFFFIGGLIVIFIVFVIMYMMSIPQGVCIGFCSISATLLIWSVFYLNRTYGTYGVMKLQARHYRPRFIINRKSISGLISRKR